MPATMPRTFGVCPNCRKPIQEINRLDRPSEVLDSFGIMVDFEFRSLPKLMLKPCRCIFRELVVTNGEISDGTLHPENKNRRRESDEIERMLGEWVAQRLPDGILADFLEERQGEHELRWMIEPLREMEELRENRTFDSDFNRYSSLFWQTLLRVKRE